MSAQLWTLTSQAFTKSVDSLRSRMKEGRHEEGSAPLPYAVAGCALTGGLTASTGMGLSPSERGTIRGLFRTAVTRCGRVLIDTHPKLVEEVRSHPSIEGNLDGGPLSRLSASDQAVKGLRGLLGDPSYVVDLRERSLLQNVPDDALWSLLTVIGFQQDALAEEYYPFHKDVAPPTVSELWEMFAPFPTDDPLPEVLRERLRMVSSPGEVESSSLKVLQSNTEGSSSSDRDRTVRLLALDGLIEADTQIGNTDRARTSLQSLRDLIAPSNDEENARFDVLTARVEAAAGNGGRAREIAHSLPSARSSVLLAEAGRILRMTGNHSEAQNVFEELSPAERPAY